MADAADNGDKTPGIRRLRADERREKVALLLARRLTAAEIVKALILTYGVDCSQRTVEGDIAAIRKEMAAKLASTTVTDVAGDVVRGFTVRERELWAMYTKAQGRKQERKEPQADGSIRLVYDVVEPEDRDLALRVLKELRASERAKLDALQSLGVVYKAPARIAADIRMMAALRELPADVVAKLAHARDDDEFMTLLTSAVGPEIAAALLVPDDGTATPALTGPVR